MKLSDNGKNTVTVDFGKHGAVSADLDSYSEEVQRYLMIRGLRKFLSDQGAGFKGDDKALKEKCQKADTKLKAGDYRSSGDRGVTVEELRAMFTKLAPEADEAAIAERIKAIHPDHAKDEKDKVKRQRKVREIANTMKALQF